MAVSPSEEIFILLFSYAPSKCHAPLLLLYKFWKLRGYYICKDSDKGRKPPGCSAVRHACHRYLLLECELAVLPCSMRHAHFTSARGTSRSLVIAAGLRDAVRSPLRSGRLFEGWKGQ